MILYYVKEKNRLVSMENIDSLSDDARKNNIIWIDMLTPSTSEVRMIEQMVGFKFPTKAESEEIEISSRYWEEDRRIEINSYFLVNNNDGNAYNETVSFVMQDHILISIRYKTLKSFDEFTKKLFLSHKDFLDGYDIFTKIVDIRIDADADTIENLGKDINSLRKKVFTDYTNEDEEILERISAAEDLNMKIRENVTDKQRILTSLLKSTKFPEHMKKEIVIMLKDVRSLIEYSVFNFERLDYLQSMFIGSLSIEQNKSIKMFTIVNVVFLPPTLIASIYGMNFKLMPGLQWASGYWILIVVMVISAVAPIGFFKLKGWI